MRPCREPRHGGGAVAKVPGRESDSHDPLFVAPGRGEVPFIREVVDKLSKSTAFVPWLTEEPAGPDRLQQLFQSTTRN
jgi:hypothetical protein